MACLSIIIKQKYTLKDSDVLHHNQFTSMLLRAKHSPQFLKHLQKMLNNLSGIFSSISELLRYVAFKNNMNLEHRQDIFALAFIQMVLHRVISVILLLFLHLCPDRSTIICQCNGKYFQLRLQDISISTEKDVLKGGFILKDYRYQ